MTDTQSLLEECSSGSKMALRSMEQIQDFLSEGELSNLIKKYQTKHEKIEKDAAEMLQEFQPGEDEGGKNGKEPPIMASAFSWMSTEVKMNFRGDEHEAAKILMDGCNMGIQSISEYENQYGESSPEAKNIAKNLVRCEEELMKELKGYL